MESNYRVLDIETTAGVVPPGFGPRLPFKEDIKPPKNYKDPEKIAAYIAEKEASYEADCEAETKKFYSRLGLRAETAEVYAIGMMDPRGNPWIAFADTGERDLLKKWVEAMLEFPACVLVGHNIKSFDLPMLVRRCIILNVTLPEWILQQYRSGKYARMVIDTMEDWCDWNQRVSLDNLCGLFGLEKKPMPKSSRSNPIKEGIENYKSWGRALQHEYLHHDITVTRQVAQRMQLIK